MLAHRIRENYKSETDRSRKRYYRLIGYSAGWGNVAGSLIFAWVVAQGSGANDAAGYSVPLAMLLIGVFSIWVGRSSMDGSVKEHLYALTYLLIPLLVLYFIEEAAVTFWAVIFIYMMTALVLQSTLLVTYAVAASLSGLLLVMAFSPEGMNVSIGTEDHLVRLVLLLSAVVVTYWGLQAGKNREKLLFHYISETEEMAFQDPILQIPNRVDFNLFVDHALRTGEVTVGKIEIVQFQAVYDVLGHQKSDELLGMVRNRLTGRLNSPAYLAKGEGSLFLAAVQEGEAAQVFEELLSDLSAPYELEQHDYLLSFSIGAACSETDGRTSDELMRNAQFALEHAKKNGLNQLVFCSDDLKQEAMNRVRISEALYQAELDKEFHLVYQPQVHLKTNEVVGVEALVRWDHPVMGRIPPNVFIEIAETNGFIVPLGKWILRRACQEVRELNASFEQPLRLGVNVSFIQIQQDQFVEETLAILKETGFPPERLEIELTERSLIENRAEDLNKIQQLRSRQIRIAIDDFGTGYSSFGILTKMSVDKIKVPREFIDHVDVYQNRRRIVETIISVAERFEVICLAEGIERAEESDFLKEQVCQEVQGYYFAKPAPMKEITSLLGNRPFTAVKEPVNG